MKKISLYFLLLAHLFSCNNKNAGPDVSGIEINLNLERFEKDFFSIDTNALPAGLQLLQNKYPGFYIDYMQGILGVSGIDTNAETQSMVKLMLSNYQPLYHEADKKMDDGKVLKETKRSFQHVKYYFPAYKLPPKGIITFIGTLDAPGIALTDEYVAAGLHQYLGKDFEGYKTEDVRQLYPDYISRRFDPLYIPVNCTKAIINDLFPDSSGKRTLVEQMVEKGKQWWLLDKLMPETADSLKTGYTQNQLDWCRQSEGLIWSYIVRNEDLNSLNPITIQTYIGEGPFTQGFSQEDSPGNMGQWIGWQIVKKFSGKNPDKSPAELMRTNASQILEEAKYKPR
jgi:hypothetical protein